MTTVTEVLLRYDTDLTEADIADGLAQALQTLPGVGAEPMTEAEVGYLAANAGGDAAATIATWDPADEHRRRARNAAAAVERLAGGSLSIDQVAALLRVDRSRISRRLSAGALYAIPIGSRRRLPAWQFHDGAELPGLATVVAAIPADVHPLDVQAFMTTPQEELRDRSPVEHLEGEGDPAPVAQLVAELARW